MEYGEESLRFWLEDEAGREREYEVVGTFTVEEKDYIAMIPMEPEDPEEAGKVVLMGFHPGEQDQVILDIIEDDEEYEQAAEIFENLFNDMAEIEAYPEEEEEPEWEDEEDYCYQDAQGNLFIYDERGEKVYLDENGDPVESI